MSCFSNVKEYVTSSNHANVDMQQAYNTNRLNRRNTSYAFGAHATVAHTVEQQYADSNQSLLMNHT